MTKLTQIVKLNCKNTRNIFSDEIGRVLNLETHANRQSRFSLSTIKISKKLDEMGSTSSVMRRSYILNLAREKFSSVLCYYVHPYGKHASDVIFFLPMLTVSSQILECKRVSKLIKNNDSFSSI